MVLILLLLTICGAARVTLAYHSHRHGLAAKARRVWSLVRKEALQVVRDPNSIAIGVVLPVLLILLFGYGLSLDVKDMPVAVVLEDPSPEATELAASFQRSPYFEAQLLTSMPRAQELMLTRNVDGIVRIRPDFARRLVVGDAEVQTLVHGTDANRARIIQSYAQRALGQQPGRPASPGHHPGVVQPESGDPLAYDPGPDRHADDAADTAADRYVRRPRA
jgi:ABC-2 type transport system permease protein